MSKYEVIAQHVYLTYSSIGNRQVNLQEASLDGSKFLKIMRESKLMGGRLDAPKVDVIYMRVSRSMKRINYGQFLEALAAAAQVKGMTLDQVFIKLVNADPSAGVTNPDYVKFHDDKDTYTGMYKLGFA